MSFRLVHTDDADANENLHMERRRYRRHDVEQQGIEVERCDPMRINPESIGTLVDISAGGVRIRGNATLYLKPDTQLKVRLRLPSYAGISPFINRQAHMQGQNEWTGWLNVRRVRTDGHVTEVAGELLDMDQLDRGMLGLYLSTQPLAA
jgi:hypothetical protein